MGTNYYLEQIHACVTCGHKPEPLHIGKSSMGWVFTLHVIPEKGISNLADWQAKWSAPGVRIVDEYGHVASPEDMLSNITVRSRDVEPLPESWFSKNHAIKGPNGLARHIVNGTHCIAHGDGTYDLCIGEFC